MTARRFLLVVAVVAALAAPATARAADAPLHEQRYVEVHVPESLPAGPVPLVLALHGCSQDGGTFPIGTRFRELADEQGFVVVFPEQDRAENASACWNWFLPDHQRRGAGEPAILAAIVDHVLATTPTDPHRVYVTGLSAGADMATVFAVSYPDKVAAVAPVAGCAYLTCADVTGEAALSAMGDAARLVPALVVQSTGDEVNNVAMGETAVQQWRNVNDLAAGGTVEDEPTWTHRGAVAGDNDDVCVRGSNYPCPAGAVGWDEYPVSIRTWEDTATGCVAAEAWTIHGAGHAWTGADPAGKYTDPAGPDLTRAVWDFFTASTACRTAS